MLSQFLGKLFAGDPLTMFPTVGLGIFMTVFLGVTIGVLLRRPSAYQALAELPLADEEVRHER